MNDVESKLRYNNNNDEGSNTNPLKMLSFLFCVSQSLGYVFILNDVLPFFVKTV